MNMNRIFLQRKTSRLIVMALILLVISACAPAKPVPIKPVENLPAGTDGKPWWFDTVFYEVFVRSYFDSNQDGVGDIRGLIEQLDYLNDGDSETTTDLGVHGLWLMPINPSPSYHGYDITNYYDVNPDYGSLDDFRRLLEEAHKRGIRVLIDLVLNHTSIDHPWFQASRDPQSPFRKWYIWSEDNPGYVGPWGEQVWYPSSGGYYYSIFWSGMADLNYQNPEVTEEAYQIARFWLQDIGVDGFRLDGARHLVEEGKSQADTAANHEWLKAFYQYCKELKPNALLVGEIWTSNLTVVSYINDGDLDLAFNFDLASNILAGVKKRLPGEANNGLFSSTKLFPDAAYATFLTNHDMNRVMSELSDDPDLAKQAATLYLTAPGVPFIYYGEELGMSGKKPDERIRTPMQWSGGDNAGFSTTRPWEALQSDYPQVNLAVEADDPASLWSHYRNLVQLRNEHVALRLGNYTAMKAGDASVLAFLRTTPDEQLLIIVNLSNDPVSNYDLTSEGVPLSGSYQPMLLYGTGDLGLVKELPVLIASEQGQVEAYQPVPVLQPNSSLIFQLRLRK